MWNARLDESQAGIKIAGRNISNLRYADDTTLMAEGEEELKSLLMKVLFSSVTQLCLTPHDPMDCSTSGFPVHHQLPELAWWKGEWKSWLKTQHSKNKDHGIWSHHFRAYRWGNNGNSERLFSWAPKSLQMVTAVMKLKDTCSLEEKLWQN